MLHLGGPPVFDPAATVIAEPTAHLLARLGLLVKISAQNKPAAAIRDNKSLDGKLVHAHPGWRFSLQLTEIGVLDQE